jgi:DNA polymerase III sliding clamp (beta) subunit (PCNA family)
MKTSDLKRALRLCRGSLQSNDLIPILTHFCFDGDSVYAFNDITAVYVSLDTGIHLGVRGDTMLGVLDTLGEEVTMGMKGQSALKLKSKRADIDLTGMPKSAFVLDIPDEPVLLIVNVDAALMRNLDMCRSTAGLNAMQREFTAVAFILEEGELAVYSTDDTRLSRYTIPAENIIDKKKGAKYFLVPAQSCRQFLDVWNDIKEEVATNPDKGAALYFTKNWCWMGIERATIFSKLMPETPPNYRGMFDQVFPQERQWAGLPDGLIDAFRRAEVLTSREPLPMLTLDVNGKNLVVTLEKGTALGTFTDSFISGAGGGKAIKLAVSPAKIREATEAAEKFMISERCIAFVNGAYVCLVAPYSGDHE